MDTFLAVSRAWNYHEVQTRRVESDVAARRFTEATSAEERLATAIREQCGWEAIRMRVRCPRPPRNNNQQNDNNNNTDEVDKNPGRAEVDMIVLTPNGIYVVEVKDYYGEVYCQGVNNERWISMVPSVQEQQHSSFYNTRPAPLHPSAPKDHGPLLEDLKHKANALIEYITRSNTARQSGLKIPYGAVVPCLVFVNDYCHLHSSAKHAHPYAMTMNEFLSAVGTRSSCQEWAAWSFPWTVPAEQLTYNMQLKILSVVDTLPTWDTIVLHNGSIKNGDVLRIVVPELAPHRHHHHHQRQQQQQQRNNNNQQQQQDIQAPWIDRSHIASAAVTWPAKGWFGLAYTLVTRTDMPSLTIVMNPGRVAPREFTAGPASAQQQQDATHGGGSGSPWRRRRNHELESVDPSTLSVPVIPIQLKPNQGQTSNQVMHVEFRPAGTGNTERIALQYITSLDLSPVSHVRGGHYNQQR